MFLIYNENTTADRYELDGLIRCPNPIRIQLTLHGLFAKNPLASVSALGLLGYAPRPCQSICITYFLLLALLRCQPRVGRMFSRWHQQLILADGAFPVVPFAFNHFTYLVDGANFP
jgi:hypothetical protein